jgi:SAM-dependent methyltransferase
MLGNPLESVQQSEEHANKGLGDSIFDMDLLSMTVEKILKFNTEREPFNKTYPNTDHLQRFFDEKAITHFAEIITKRYNENKKPVSIVDICCGYGMQIITLREKLTKNGVEIAKIVGYDISKDMIQLAQERNTYWPEVDFERKNIETDFCSVEEFDVAICLFGLQWMNELEPTIQAIHRSLKPGGIFLSLTPIEIHDLFDMRNNFLNYSKWSETFDISARLIHPFHYSKDDYLQPMSKLFKTVHEEKK